MSLAVGLRRCPPSPTDTGAFVEVAHHNPTFFTGPLTNPDFLTLDEEASGIIDAQHVLGEGWFLFDVQAHFTNPDPELVEGDQLLAMYVHPTIARTPSA